MGGISPADTSKHIIEHLNEASNRIQRVMFALVIVAVIWAFLIDDIFSWWLSRIPLADGSGSLTIYSPYSWLDTRWTAVGLLSIWVLMPWIATEIWWFSKPGLLPRERTWLFALSTIGILFGSLIIIVGWLWGFPKLVAISQATSMIDGIGSHYDVVSLFQMALSLSWLVVIIFLSSVSLTFARALGMVDEDPLHPFRIRLHFIAIVLLYIVTPPAFQGLFFTTAVTIIFISEFIANLSPFVNKPRGRSPTTVFDSEGGERRVLVVDCICEGACGRIVEQNLPSNVGLLLADSLCLNSDEAEQLYERVLLEKVSDVVISGCDASPIPGELKSSLLSSNCNYYGLNRLNKVLTSDLAPKSIVNFADRLDLSLSSCPWSKQSQSRIQNRIAQDKKDQVRFVSSISGLQPWGTRFTDNEIWIETGGLIDSNLDISLRE